MTKYKPELEQSIREVVIEKFRNKYRAPWDPVFMHRIIDANTGEILFKTEYESDCKFTARERGWKILNTKKNELQEA